MNKVHQPATAMLALASVALAGCGFARTASHESGTITQIAREFLNAKPGNALLNRSAAEAQLTGMLSPLKTVGEEDQPQVFKTACQAVNMYQLGQVSSLKEGVDWVSSQGPTTGARRQAALQLAESLSQWNSNPTLLGGNDGTERTPGALEVTGSALCMFQ